MNQNSVKTIGINDEPRKDSYLVYLNQADGLKEIQKFWPKNYNNTVNLSWQIEIQIIKKL